MMKKSKKRLILGIVAAFLVVCVIGTAVYVNDYYRASEDVLATAYGSSVIQVEEADGKIVFMPKEPESGLIFYPGGKVEYTAYAPLMQKFAEQGIACVLVEMPANLAVLDMNAADGIKELYPEIENWYMGGHSLGGSMAASYAAEHSDEYEGLLLLASYSTEDLNEKGLQVFSLYGSEDKVLNMEKYEEYRVNLPEDTVEQVIEGGCHAYFGDYGAQDGDGEPTITVEEQIAVTVECIVSHILD